MVPYARLYIYIYIYYLGFCVIPCRVRLKLSELKQSAGCPHSKACAFPKWVPKMVYYEVGLYKFTGIMLARYTML